MKLHPLIWLAVALMTGEMARAQLQVFDSTTDIPERGKVASLLVISGEDRFSLLSPVGYAGRLDEERKKIVFTGTAGKSAMTMEVTTNFPGSLPDENVLKKRVQALYPGANIITSAPCVTSLRQGWSVEAVKLIAENLSLTIRCVFIPFRHGTIEFIYSADTSEYDKGRIPFMSVLSSLRMITGKETR